MILIFGATQPLGQAVALGFAERGTRVVLVDRDAQALEAVCAHNPDWIEAVVIDDLARDLRRTVQGRWAGQRIDLVLNLMPLSASAGGDISGQMRVLTAIVQTTLRGLVAGQGCLVNVAHAAEDPLAFVAHGMVSALREAGQALAGATADKGVRVHCVTVPTGAQSSALKTVQFLGSGAAARLGSTTLELT